MFFTGTAEMDLDDPYTPNVIRNLRDERQPFRDDLHDASVTLEPDDTWHYDPEIKTVWCDESSCQPKRDNRRFVLEYCLSTKDALALSS